MIMHSSEILNWLFLGGETNASNHKELKVRTEVTHILNVACEAGCFFKEDFITKKIDMRDAIDEDIS